MNVGDRIRVKSVQHCFGKPRYPNRVGVIIRMNPIGEGYCYVELDATQRAKTRIEHFHESDLDRIEAHN